MTVEELIRKLQRMPPSAVVRVHYDGAARGCGTTAWLNQAGEVSIGNAAEPVYDDEDRSMDAVSTSVNRYLYVYEMLGLPRDYGDDEIDRW